jgi:hypothetical protein
MNIKDGEGVGTSIFAKGKARVFNVRRLRNALLAGVLLARLASAAVADTNEVAQSGSGSSCPVLDYFADWYVRVDKTRAEQPHWAPPVATTSPALQEVLRYDIMQQSLKGGRTLTTFGSGKGLEFIPTERIQFIIGLPSWQSENTTPRKDGWADESFLMKYRLLSANEAEGNYVLTLFAGLTAPTGSETFTTHHYTFSPTIAGGKGWGDFNVQSTLGLSVPDNGTAHGGLGTPILDNTVLQYRVAKVFWPEVEANYTYWPNGKNGGLNQLFITPGLVLGKFHIWERLGMMIGAGCQIAVTDRPLYHRNLIITARFAF